VASSFTGATCWPTEDDRRSAAGHVFSVPSAGYTEADMLPGPIEIADFADEGVTLTPVTAPDFDRRAQTILADDASPVLELKPYLTLVRNDNPRTVVAYTVAWTVTRRNDTLEVNYSQFKFPDAVAGASHGLAMLAGREIRSGTERLTGMGFEAWPPEYADTLREYGLRAAAHLGDTKGLAIALDGVIFEDGTMLGPDRSRLAEHFIEFVHAKQSLYRDIVVGLEGGGDVRDDVFAPLRETLETRRQAAHPDSMLVYRRQAAAEILAFHDRVALEVFRRTLRREPFTIRRLSGK
jgi:hypothetical protein